MKTAMLICFIILLCFTTKVFAQTPVKMSGQTDMTFTEDFTDIRNWGDDFSSGNGAEHWSSVPVNNGGTIPDGYTTTIATDAFKYGFSAGVQKSPGSTTDTYMAFLVNGSSDNSDALAVDFYVDFSGVTAGKLSFDAATVNNGVTTSNRVSTLQVYYSLDGTVFTRLNNAKYEAINYTSDPATVEVNLPNIFDDQPQVIFRFYEYNGTGGDNGSRPKISIDNLTVTADGSILPVSLAYFTARRIKENVQLEWMTDSEQNTSYFAVQRSYNGNDFSTVSKITATGSNISAAKYSYMDDPVLFNELFYRLKIADKDGRFTYSKIIRVSPTPMLSKIYPDPVHTNLSLRWNIPVNNKKEVDIINASGKICITAYLEPGANQLNIPVAKLSPGQYWVKVAGNGQPEVFPFIKQ